MVRLRTDKLTCKDCKLTEPAVSIACKNGKPIGQCKDCKRNYEIQARLRRNFHLNLYKSQPNLVAANLKIIATLQNACYYLTLATNKAQVGYIIVQNSEIFVNLHNRSDLFYKDFWAIASYLGNSGACIDPKPIPNEDNGKAFQIDPNELASLTPTDCQTRILWLDKAYRDASLKMIRDEIRQAKQANMIIARSNNPKAKD